jgi:hypothetical protein
MIIIEGGFKTSTQAENGRLDSEIVWRFGPNLRGVSSLHPSFLPLSSHLALCIPSLSLFLSLSYIGSLYFPYTSVGDRLLHPKVEGKRWRHRYSHLSLLVYSQYEGFKPWLVNVAIVIKGRWIVVFVGICRLRGLEMKMCFTPHRFH